MVRHGGCLGLGLAAMGSARQGRNFESKFTTVETPICGHSWDGNEVSFTGASHLRECFSHCGH